MAKRKTKKTAECPHPPTRLYSWLARDDFAPRQRGIPAGKVLCVVCCECGKVLAGGC